MEETEQKRNGTGSRFYQKLLFRLFLYFALVVCMFAILLSIIYMKLYENSTIHTFRDDLVKKAEQISQNVSIYARYGNNDDETETGRSAKKVKSSREKAEDAFLAYYDAIETVFEQKQTDIYIISNPLAAYALDDAFTNCDSAHLIEKEFPKDVMKVLQAAFDGNVAFNTGYDSFYYRKNVRVSVPIRDVGGNVNGAVMIIATPQAQEILNNSQKYITISSIAALLLSFIVSIFLANQFSRPISVMRKVALRLSEGDYEINTNIHQGGEIGDLAKSIDILSVKLKENEAVRNNMEQMRRDFFANVSHELRTPITVMRGYSEMLVDGVVTKEEKKVQYYERMLSECKSMERLVGDLLILSKMQNPDFCIEMEPVNLIQIFHDIIRGIHVVAVKKNISISFLHESDRVMMMGDYDRLRQMFMIILDNAIKFSMEDSVIKIEVQVHNNITVTITDQGVGIAKEELPFIFEKFYKSKLRQNAQGSGLGLVIAKQIALKHNGKIEVESELGKGSTFQFIFDKTYIKMI